MNISIFDTTLRDGEQSPGAAMTAPDRLRVALALDAAGVDVIEAGFPASSPAVLASVREISAHVQNAEVASFCRLIHSDIDAAWSAVKGARRPRLFSFIPTSDEHIAVKLRSHRYDVLRAVDAQVRYMASLTKNVAFGAEDATRSDPDFLVTVFNTAARAGATVVVLPDTVGCLFPAEYGALVRYVRDRLPDGVALSAHCHDDLGLAVANTLEAVRNGASEIQVTINGIGERAGNCSLEEAVVALRLRTDYFGKTVAFDTRKLAALSALVAEAADMPVAKNKAIVGKHAFSHESGIHQDGVLKKRSLYEFVPAEMVGRSPAELSFGRNSGRNGLRSRFDSLGVRLSGGELNRAYQLFLNVANASRSVDDAQLLQIARTAAESNLEIVG
jgi:2-isopropylmalate synthase